MNPFPKYTFEEMCINIKISDARYAIVEGDDDIAIYTSLFEMKMSRQDRPEIIACEEITNPGCGAIESLVNEYVSTRKHPKIDANLRFIVDGDGKQIFRTPHSISDTTLRILSLYSIESYFCTTDAIKKYYSVLNKSKRYPGINIIAAHVENQFQTNLDELIPVAYEAYLVDQRRSTRSNLSYRTEARAANNQAMINGCKSIHGSKHDILAREGFHNSSEFCLQFTKGKWAIYRFAATLIDSHTDAQNLCKTLKATSSQRNCACTTTHCRLRRMHRISDATAIIDYLMSDITISDHERIYNEVWN